MKIFVIPFLVGLFVSGAATAAEPGGLLKPISDNRPQHPSKTSPPVQPPIDAGKLLVLIEESRANKKHDNADFYLARYLGLSVLGAPGFSHEKGHRELLKHPSWSTPTSMISGRYQNNFLEYFNDASFAMWALARPVSYDLQGRRILLREASDDRNYVVVWGRPTFRTWVIMARTKMQKMVVAHSRDLALQFGKRDVNGRPSACGRIDLPGEVVWLYQPVFRRLFPGERKNLVIRFNQPTADGYVQYLKIYGFNSEKNPCVPVMLAQFKGRNGLARLKGNVIEISEETGASGESAFTKSFQKLQRLRFDGRQFVKHGTPELMPNFLHQPDGWPEYLVER